MFRCSSTARFLASRLGAGVFLALAVASVGAAPVAAHAYLISTDPADGAALGTAPTAAHLTFSEDVVSGWSTVELVGPGGERLDASIPDVGTTRVLEIDLPELETGTYRLDWQTVSADDYHATDGSIVFGVGRAAAGTGSATTSAAGTDPGEAVFGATNVAALVLLLGALALWSALAGNTRRMDANGETRVLARPIIGAAALAAIAALLLAFAEHVARPLPIGATSSTAPLASTMSFLVRVGALLALSMLLLPAWRTTTQRAGPEGRLLPMVAFGLALCAVAARTFGSHAAAGDARALGIALGTTHLVAAGIWVGGVSLLGLVMVPMAWRRPALRKAAFAALRGFGIRAALSLAALAITGLVMLGRLVASPDALLVSPYGHLLLLKMALVSLAAAAGLANSAAINPWVRNRIGPLTRMVARLRPRPSWIRGLLVAELVAATAAVLMAGVLGATAPANGPEFRAAADDVPPPPVVRRVDDLILSAAIRPDRPGPNFATVEVLDTRRPSPGRVTRVEVTLRPIGEGGTAIVAQAQQVDGQRWEVSGLPIDRSGRWTMSAVIDRVGLPPTRLDASWHVKVAVPPVQRQPTVIADFRLAPIANLAAVVVLAAALATVVGVTLRRRTRAAPVPAPERASVEA